MDPIAADLVTIALLVVLECLLSADNALVIAIMVLGLPKRQQAQALRYGLVGGFAMRTAATLLAVYLIQLIFVKLLGCLYLLYLAHAHFFRHEHGKDRRQAPMARPWLGMSAFWATVVRVELVNLAFSIDSILVAVAMSPKPWVVVTGGILGIVAMRVVAGQLIALVQRYPAIIDGAFIIIAWIGIKLALEYLHEAHYTTLDIPRWLSLGLVVIIFIISFVYAKLQGPAPADGDTLAEKAEHLLEDEDMTVIDAVDRKVAK